MEGGDDGGSSSSSSTNLVSNEFSPGRLPLGPSVSSPPSAPSDPRMRISSSSPGRRRARNNADESNNASSSSFDAINLAGDGVGVSGTNSAGAGAGPSSPPFRFDYHRSDGGRDSGASSLLDGRALLSKKSWRLISDPRGESAKASAHFPGPRSGAAAVVEGGKLYMFGGYGGSGRLDDFYEYDFASKVWTKLECRGGSPGVRENNGVVVQGRCLYLFGGYNGTSWLNDFHEFNLDTREWRVVEPRGNFPNARFGYVSMIYKKKFVLWGGYDGRSWLNDMYEYDFETRMWSSIVLAGNVPSVRSCPSWARRGNSVFVLGGYDGVQRMNDFWEFNLETYVWSPVPCTGGSPPSPRYFHASVVFGDCLYAFCGYDGHTRLNDMHCFDFNTHSWSLVECCGDVPSGRSSLVAQVYQNALFIFGGYNGQIVLNDFYEFRFSPFVIPPPKLVEDMRRLIDNPDISDVVFLVEGREIHAVRAHLGVRSEHFRALLFGGMRESSRSSNSNIDGKVVIPMPEVQYDVFMRILEFMYTDAVVDLNYDLAVPLLIAAERYLLDRLKALCEEVIRRNVSSKNVVAVLIASYRHNAAGLKEICLQFITDNLEMVKQTDEFADLTHEPELLLEIIMRQSKKGG